jgi:hypothetical protein
LISLQIIAFWHCAGYEKVKYLASMIKRPGFAIICGLVILLAGCRSKRSTLGNLWFYTHTSGISSSNELGVSPASFLDLQPDGHYTRDFGTFDLGTWDKKENQLVLTSSNGNSFTFPIRQLKSNELQLESAKGTLINFEKQPANFKNADENPFSRDNNEWRIKAMHKESDAEIRSRLKNHFRFHEVYITWALESQFTSLDVRSTPSLIKIYGNGFAMKKIEDLPDAWRSYFFDAEDCRKANEIVTDIFKNQNISWTHIKQKDPRIVL